MKKTWLFASLMCVLISTCALAVGGTLPGSGTEADPYLIEDVNDFDAFANPMNAATYWAAGVHTKLMTDIDLSGRTYTTAVIAPDTDTETWWHQGTPFTGVFDGNDKIISGFMVNQPDISQIGIFGAIKTGGRVSSLNITDVNIIGYDYIAGLAGHIDNATVENCKVSGTLRCEGYTAGGVVAGAYTSSTISNCQSTVTIYSVGHSVGGLVGYNDHSSVVNCHSCSEVSGEYANLGGLIGYNRYGTVAYCSSTSTVFITGPYVDHVGGLIGCSENGSISFCWSNSQITGTSEAGGLIGCSGSLIENSYSIGKISGDNEIGGLVGYNYDTVNKCYSSCNVSGSSYTGGLLGLTSKDMTNSFWDVESSGTTLAYTLRSGYPYSYIPIYNIPDIVEGKTTAEMMTQSTFTGWDFDPDDGDPADWMMLRPGEDYPRLAWQEVFAGDIAGLYGADMVDFAYLANYWGLTGCSSGTDCGRADIDDSDDVGLGDLAAVANDWLK